MPGRAGNTRNTRVPEPGLEPDHSERRRRGRQRVPQRVPLRQPRPAHLSPRQGLDSRERLRARQRQDQDSRSRPAQLRSFPGQTAPTSGPGDSASACGGDGEMERRAAPPKQEEEQDREPGGAAGHDTPRPRVVLRARGRRAQAPGALHSHTHRARGPWRSGCTTQVPGSQARPPANRQQRRACATHTHTHACAGSTGRPRTHTLRTTRPAGGPAHHRLVGWVG